MNELKEFTAEEMKGVPPFELGEDRHFISSDGKDIHWEYCSTHGTLHPKYKSFLMCNPLDRMKAICKHLFELMPYKDVIEIWNGKVYISCSDSYSDDDSVRLSINPFLHTGVTQITREEI